MFIKILDRYWITISQLYFFKKSFPILIARTFTWVNWVDPFREEWRQHWPGIAVFTRGLTLTSVSRFWVWELIKVWKWDKGLWISLGQLTWLSACPSVLAAAVQQSISPATRNIALGAAPPDPSILILLTVMVISDAWFPTVLCCHLTAFISFYFNQAFILKFPNF